ncbi:MAG: NAD(+) synthase, partial [Oscillospiraceae bacterium]|nr:NAD(+) synthase [Oscillospiraceae bacterium]
ALGLPRALVDKVPIDGLCGKTDEDNLGFTYHAVNEYVRRGICDEETRAKIDHKHRISRFKFQTIPVYHNGLPIVLEESSGYYK